MSFTHFKYESNLTEASSTRNTKTTFYSSEPIDTCPQINYHLSFYRKKNRIYLAKPKDEISEAICYSPQLVIKKLSGWDRGNIKERKNGIVTLYTSLKEFYSSENKKMNFKNWKI